MRAEATVKNSIWGIFQQVVICILSLFSRRVMIETIGVEGVGLNGLLTNVVTMLSMAEMGLGGAIVYHMYGPLARGEHEMIARLMNFYRKMYTVIAGTILTLGLCLMPFMRFIVKDLKTGKYVNHHYVLLIYFLFLMQTVTTYLFAYKRSLLSADQKYYIISIFDLIYKIVTIFGGIVILKLTKELAWYLLFLTVAAIVNNLAIAHKADTLYPYVKKNKLKLPREHQRSIFGDVKNIFIGKISGTITNSTDNILISALVGTVVTGLYSNYTIILNTLTSMMNQLSYSMTGSIGNLLAKESADRVEDVLKKLVFFMFFMATLCCACLTCLVDPFITMAFGEGLLLERYVVYICITVFYFATIKIPVWNMVQASGLFKIDKYIAIAGSTINLIVSFILGKQIGIAGILIGTVCTYVIQYTFKIVLFYNKFLHKSYRSILFATYGYFLLAAAECLFLGFVTKKFPIENPYLSFVVSGIIAAVFALGLNTFIFMKTDAFRYFVNKFSSMIKKKLKKTV